MSPLSSSLSLSARLSSNSWKKFLLHLLYSIFHEAPSILPLKFLCTGPFSRSHCASPRPGSHPLCTPRLPRETLGRVPCLWPLHLRSIPHGQARLLFLKAVCILGMPQLGIPGLSKLCGISQTALVAPCAVSFLPRAVAVLITQGCYNESHEVGDLKNNSLVFLQFRSPET